MALKIINVEIIGTVIFKSDSLTGRIIIKPNCVVAGFLCDNNVAIKEIFGGNTVYAFACAYAAVVITVGHIGTVGLGGVSKPPAACPLEGGAVIGG